MNIGYITQHWQLLQELELETLKTLSIIRIRKLENALLVQETYYAKL